MEMSLIIEISLSNLMTYVKLLSHLICNDRRKIFYK